MLYAVRSKIPLIVLVFCMLQSQALAINEEPVADSLEGFVLPSADHLPAPLDGVCVHEQTAPGCFDNAVEACVCEGTDALGGVPDPFCCSSSGRWDSYCIDRAVDFCGATHDAAADDEVSFLLLNRQTRTMTRGLHRYLEFDSVPLNRGNMVIDRYGLMMVPATGVYHFNVTASIGPTEIDPDSCQWSPYVASIRMQIGAGDGDRWIRVAHGHSTRGRCDSVNLQGSVTVPLKKGELILWTIGTPLDSYDVFGMPYGEGTIYSHLSGFRVH